MLHNNMGDILECSGTFDRYVWRRIDSTNRKLSYLNQCYTVANIVY